MNRLKLMLCGCIGVLLTVLAAAVVFPARARTRLRKSTARILEDTGNLAFHLLGEFCQVRRSLDCGPARKTPPGAFDNIPGPLFTERLQLQNVRM